LGRDPEHLGVQRPALSFSCQSYASSATHEYEQSYRHEAHSDLSQYQLHHQLAAPFAILHRTYSKLRLSTAIIPLREVFVDPILSVGSCGSGNSETNGFGASAHCWQAGKEEELT